MKLRTAALGFLTILLAFYSTTGLASAHVLKEDNGISAVLHIPPEDNPQAGQSTQLDFFFGDTKNTFSLPDCNCRILVQHGGQTIQQQAAKPAQAGDTLDSIVTVNFPAIGVYNVIAEGTAKDGKFNNFKLIYLVRVAVSANGSPATTSGLGEDVTLISLGSLAILGLFAYNAISAGGRYSKAKARSGRDKKVK